MRELERERTDTSAPNPALSPIAVIGRGRLGGSVASAARAAGLAVHHAGREDLDAACARAAVVLLCVPDAEIATACERVSAHVPPVRAVAHPSGASGLDALAAAERAGAATFSLHPLQTIPDPTAPLTGAHAAISGSEPRSLELARALAEALGMVPFELPEDARGAYHAAASIASNFLVALEESATELLAAAGVEDGREILAPLVLRTAANWAERGGEALTGPIVRGDEETVARHLRALEGAAPELLPLYEALAERTRQLAGGAARRS